MIISKKRFQHELEREVKLRTIELQASIMELSGKLEAKESHIKFLDNHIERHVQCRKIAEEKLMHVYDTALDTTKVLLGQHSLKEILEAQKERKG